MLQLVRQVFKDPEDDTDLFLIFANQVSIIISAVTSIISNVANVFIWHKWNIVNQANILLWLWCCFRAVRILYVLTKLSSFSYRAKT